MLRCLLTAPMIVLFFAINGAVCVAYIDAAKSDFITISKCKTL